MCKTYILSTVQFPQTTSNIKEKCVSHLAIITVIYIPNQYLCAFNSMTSVQLQTTYHETCSAVPQLIFKSFE